LSAKLAADLDRNNLVQVTLTIGDDSGAASVAAKSIDGSLSEHVGEVPSLKA
jgi:hypothetical protein